MHCFGHSGSCCRQDDVQGFCPALRACGMLVYATPVYWLTLLTRIKAFIDRMLCTAAKSFGIESSALLVTFEDKVASVCRYIVDTHRPFTPYTRIRDDGFSGQQRLREGSHRLKPRPCPHL